MLDNSTKNLTTEIATVSTNDGEMRIYVAQPKTPPKTKVPAIIVYQEAFGVNAHIKDVCHKFANMGLVAAAPELFHRMGHGTDIPYSDFARVMPTLGKINNKQMLIDARATYSFLVELPNVEKTRIASTGYCLGGFVSLLTACHLPMRTTISAYGGGLVNVRPNIGLTPFLEDFKDLSGSVLLLYGAKDQGISESDRNTVLNKLKALNKPVEMIVYPDAGHAFMCDDRPAYHPASAADAWAKSQTWLTKHLLP